MSAVIVWSWMLALVSAIMMLCGAALAERGERLGYWVLGLASAGALCSAVSLWMQTGVFG